MTRPFSPPRALAVVIPLALILPAAPRSRADTWTIRPDGSGDFATIQDAIDAAADGDEIVLEDGTYTGDRNRRLDYAGKSLTIRSLGGNPDLCVIDGSDDDAPCEAGIRFVGSTDAALEGISIIDVMSCFPYPWALPVVDAGGASARLRDVVVKGCWTEAAVAVGAGGSLELDRCRLGPNEGGGLLAADGGVATLTGCVIGANSGAGSTGAGILVSTGGRVILESCLVRGNATHWVLNWAHGAGIHVDGGTLEMRGCLVTENGPVTKGGGLYVAAGTALIERSTLGGNRAEAGGAIFAAGGMIAMSSSIVWANCSDAGAEEIRLEPGAILSASCSDLAGVEGGGTYLPGPGVISEDPLFCAPRACTDPQGVAGLYSLPPISPARHVPGCGTMGAIYGTCSVAVAPSTWGRIKSMHRSP